MSVREVGFPRVLVQAAVLVLLAAPVSVVAKVVCVNTATGNDASDGLSWATPKQKVTAGLTAAVSGDQVWVAKGTYVECITLKAGVALYGGFAGTETDLSQRNWMANKTVLDGNQAGSVVTSPSGATAATRIDGFTIRNGIGAFSLGSYYGGGLYCVSSSPTIANNTITGNTASDSGGGIYCSLSSATIVNNTITRNTAVKDGAGICCSRSSATIANNVIAANTAVTAGGIHCCYSSSPVIVNNVLSGNTGGAILCHDGSSPMITNNTIVGNVGAGGAVDSQLSSPIIRNTVVAFNSSGINTYGGSVALTFNCVYRNARYDYAGLSDPTGTNGNISTDPGLAGWQYGHAHLLPNSPCVDAGDDSAVQASWLDLDGQPRVLGPRVDIGADESDGTEPSAGPNVIVRVASDGNDANDGSSWAVAKRTVQAGIDVASVVGGDVWVKAGTYPERISLRHCVHVFGGFRGSEATRDRRDFRSNVTILDGQKGGSVVMAQSAGSGLNTIDGFTIRNGTGTVSTSSTYGGGVYCSSSSPTIANNTITGNTASQGGGIYCSESSPIIRDNTIAANTAQSSGFGGGGAIFCSGYAPIITNNAITGNVASNGGGVLCNYYSKATIANNVIAANRAWWGGGVYCSSNSVPIILNNVIARNTANYAGGFSCDSYSSPVLRSTIIAFNSSGVYRSGTASPTLMYNCVYGNTGYNFSGLTDPTGTNGNISVDPLFVNAAASDFHLLPPSPCIDAGDPASDYSLEPEPDGGRINMGACGNTPEAETKGWLYTDNYGQVRKTRVGRTLFEYQLNVTMRNASTSAVENVVATLAQAPANVQIIDGTVNVGAVPAGGSVVSQDTFTIRVDRATLVSPLPISWRVTYAGGTGMFRTLLDLGIAGRSSGDFDGDGDVDMSDFGAFQSCFNGANRPPAKSACEPVDFDGDADVDLGDFAAFQECFNGPNRPSACSGE